MAEKRVQFNKIVKNQLPSYVQEEFPLIGEFLTQYYLGQEFQGAPVDLIQNIDSYLKLNECGSVTKTTSLTSAVEVTDTTISVLNTNGFPDNYGLIRINDEIITYTSKTDVSFVGCIRGFSGITSFTNEDNEEDLVFSTSSVDSHDNESEVENLSVLFLEKFLEKIKKQFLPGLSGRELSADLNEAQFIRNSKSFYSTRGTDESFRILFKSLYNEDAEIIRPRDYVISPSNANYKKTRDLIVESVSGDPFDLLNKTLFQDEFENISKAYAPVSNIQNVSVGILTDNFYKISIDPSFNQNDGSTELLYGNFSVHAKTKIIGEVGAGQTFLDVDSTLGFPKTGTIAFEYNDGTSGVATYSNKTVNQFLGIATDAITGTVLDKSDVDQNTFAYSAGAGSTDGIRVKIRSVLSELSVPSNTYYQKKGSKIKIKSLGKVADHVKSNKWIFNTAPNYTVQSLSLVDAANNTYNLTTKDANILRIGDKLKLEDTAENVLENEFIVTDVFNSKSCLIRGLGISNPNLIVKITKIISKIDSDLHSDLNQITANVQNVYVDADKNLVASSSLPYFSGLKLNPTTQKITFSGTFNKDQEIFQITTGVDHNFFTGDAVYYTPQKGSVTTVSSGGESIFQEYVISSLFDEGIYFVDRVDSNRVRLAKSRSNLYNNIFVSVDITNDNVTIQSNTIEKYEFKGKSIKPQKLLREVSNPNDNGNQYHTIPGYTGILVNGVEVLNYKSRNFVYYGQIDSIDVVSGGEGYDVINPPLLNVTDSVGSGATGYCAVKGSVEEIRVLNSGFDYLEVPIVKITGGNGTGATAEAKLATVPHEVTFDASDTGTAISGVGTVGIGSDISTIGFSTYHKFRNGERVVYNTFGRRAISGLSTGAVYYARVNDANTIKLHKSLDDSIVGVNTVSLLDYGDGIHAFNSLNGKAVVNSIKVTNPGFNYENKKRTCSPVGINTALNTININNHGFNNGEIVTYSFEDTSVAGLSTSKDYYVTKINDDSFRLSAVGVGTTVKDFYFKTSQYENLTNSGVGTHNFNYPEIRVEVIGKVGISSVGEETFQAVAQPIVRGEITSIYLTGNGVGYGSSEILNFERYPDINVYSGSSAELTPIIENSKIVDVIVSRPGRGYNSPPNLSVTGIGTGADLIPVIVDGQIKSVKINKSGVGYGMSTTQIDVVVPGKNASFKTNLQKWRVNEYRKNYSNITNDDVFISKSINSNFELECSYVYAPRSLRRVLYASDQEGNTLYGKRDLTFVNGIESNIDSHSPIIGWSYDGYPIYGPYAYNQKSGGNITQMKSGYSIKLKTNRPPLSSFPEEFFVEDFTWSSNVGEDYLDENNGRFCVTPEFPNGTYAYFATFETTAAADGVFKNYKKPAFPYLIGNSFKSKPNDFNFDPKSNQDEIDLNDSDWIRNTYPYALNKENSGYDYVRESYKYVTQDSTIKFAEKGSVDSIGIVTGGLNYRVNDKVVFENNLNGLNAVAKVSKVSGPGIGTISVSNTTLTNVEFYSIGNGNFLGVHTSPHNLYNNSFVVVSGLNTTNSLLSGEHTIGVSTNKLRLTKQVGDSDTTGIVTYFSVSGNLTEPDLKENDILRIESERVKVLNVDRLSSRIRVLRSVDSTVSAAHTITTILEDLPRKLTINVGYKTSFDEKVNKQYYFNPTESVGFGTNSGAGIGVTLSFSNPGAGITQIFVPTQSIYIPNHKLETGDEVTYQVNDGDTIGISTNTDSAGIGVSVPLTNHSTLYVARLSNDLVGLSTVKVGLGTTGSFVGIADTTEHQGLVYFVGLGTGTYHSLTVSYPGVVKGTVEKNLVTVAAAGTHGLLNNDTVYVDVNPAITTSVTIKYNAANRKLVGSGLDFSASGVTTSTDTIYLDSHGLVNGQKVIHTSSSPSGGLLNDREYYVYVVDRNNIKLTETKFETTKRIPNFIDISSASSGTILPVNPPLKLYRNSTAIFNLNDSSLSYSRGTSTFPGFSFEFYRDSNFTQRYETSGATDKFDITQTGTIGVSGDAKVSLLVNENTPDVLYYKLKPLQIAGNSTANLEYVVDDTVNSNNKILVRSSKYSGEHDIISTSPNTFTYDLKEYPESSSYSSTQSSLNYETDSLTAYGTISEVRVSDKGKGYFELPGITTVTSSTGTGAILEANSTSIGRVRTTTIDNIGFDYPSDLTLRPEANLPQVLKLDPLSSFESIGITSFGTGYNTAPKLVVVDGRTKKQITDVDLRYVLGQNKVDILQNTYSLSNTTPTIIPTQNPNGIRVSNLSYNSSTQEVTATLKTAYSTLDTFPLSVNDKVLVENVSVGVGSTGKGYNSSGYDYALFTLTEVHPNLGGIGIVTFSLADYLSVGEIPGNFDSINSSTTLVPEKYFPQFDPILAASTFRKSDTVESDSNSGTIFDWNEETKQMIVETSNNFEVGEIITSRNTGTRGLITGETSFESRYDFDYFSIVDNGWEYTTGFLNDELQRIHDNEYYQNFSYSIKSKVPYEDWNSAVSSLTHTSGFRKFSDLQIESKLPEINVDTLSPSPVPDVSTQIDIISTYDLNCVPNFDLVSENYLSNEIVAFSDEINFSSRILTDYAESIGNRVLTIDDISSEFNDVPRSTPYSEVFRRRLSDARVQKFVTYVRDRLYTGERQLMMVTVLNDIGRGVSMINQYGRMESVLDLGSFDYTIDGTDGVLLFYPTKYVLNNYNVVTYSYNIDQLNLDNTDLVSIGSTTIGVSTTPGFPGALVSVATSNILANGASPQTMVTLAGIGTTTSGTRSAKILVSIEANDGRVQYDELNVIHDGSDVDILEYGQLSIHSLDEYSAVSLGTYHPYLSGSDLKIDYTPAVGIVTAKLNTIAVAISSESYIGLGTFYLTNAQLTAKGIDIPSSGSPSAVGVASYFNDYDAAYCLVQISDTSNNEYQFSEVLIIDDNSEVYITEYATIETSSGLGTFGGTRTGDITELTFTPNSGIDVHVKTVAHALRITDNQDVSNIKDLNNASLESSYSTYTGTEASIKKDFFLTHKTNPIFTRVFDGSDSEVVDLDDNTITLPNHFFVSGEEVVYAPQAGVGTDSIGIGTTTFAGVGSTDGLPSSVYVIKVSDNKIRLASSAENALKKIPVALDFVSVGIGTSHSFTSRNQNQKVLVSIDNAIQSPIVGTSVTTSLASPILASEDLIYFTGITSFFGADYVQVDNEIMKILSIGVGATNAIKVTRAWLGTTLVGHSSGAKVTKIRGNYNIVGNYLNFIEAPHGNNPIGTITDPPSFRDWIGISTSSTFNGRVFIRSGIVGASTETYSTNYLYDDISGDFTGYEKTFKLRSNKNDVVGVSTNNAIIMINGVFQGPGISYDYTLSENTGVTSITFTGTASSVAYDPNNASIPVGGVIISVGSSAGFGYQPLVSAGGTAIVSAAGTISSVSIGNSGSGYRVGVQTVRVGVAESSTGTPSIEYIGTAVVSNGHIVSIAVTNPGVGYTSTNPPYVIIDAPLSYVNIPLQYSADSPGSGGAQAQINVVVGQGSSVIDFEIVNTGYGYGVGQILTLPTGGLTGIPTTSSANFEEFRVEIQEVDGDEFTGWSVGQIQVLDDFSNLFDGKRKTFPITNGGNSLSIQAKPGSSITIQDTLLIFINDILQVPGESYTFGGGSNISFIEAPKQGDSLKFLFYRGTGGSDVIDTEVIDTVKIGDDLTIGYSADLDQNRFSQQSTRTVVEVNSSSSVDSSVYYGPGLQAETLPLRPVQWCRQTEDRIIDGKVVSKDRELYEPIIFPSAYLIQSVGVGTTIVYVDNVRPFFNPINENNISVDFQKDIVIVDYGDRVSAAATAVVSAAGTISSVVISGGGVGYTTNPDVSIANPVGLGTTARALATSTISVGGTVSSITVTTPGVGYTDTNPPVVLVGPPTFVTETNTILSYEGDFGIITGISTTSVGVASTGIVFDLVIPENSFLRDSTVTSYTATSGIDTGYYFIVYNSNIGSGVTSLDEVNSVVGVGTSFLDNIYKVAQVSTATTSAIGFGETTVARVTVSVSDYNGLTGLGFSNFYGEYSWGRLSLSDRGQLTAYDAITTNGVTGIKTGPVVKRQRSMKYQSYSS